MGRRPDNRLFCGADRCQLPRQPPSRQLVAGVFCQRHPLLASPWERINNGLLTNDAEKRIRQVSVRFAATAHLYVGFRGSVCPRYLLRSLETEDTGLYYIKTKEENEEVGKKISIYARFK